MKLHHFIGNFDFSSKNIVVNDHEMLHQIQDVLKLKKGERIVLCDGKGTKATAILQDISKSGFSVDVIDVIHVEKSIREVVLYCSILKKDNFEWVTQKTTEIGVSKIVPVISQRTIKLDVKIDRLKKIIREAAEQSELAYVPTLEEPTSFRKALDNARSCNEVFFCDASGESLKNAKLEQSGEVAIFIGPEGGWTEAEIEIARKAGFKISSLGNSILRGETAAIAASFAVSSLL